VLGTERMGTGIAIAPLEVLTAHYLVLGAEAVEVLAFDGRARMVKASRVDHETGLALLRLEGPDLPPTLLAPTGDVPPGTPSSC
jgi:S1-C subfamily serine protease